MSDRILGGLGVVVAAFYIWQASLTELSFITDPVGPKTFPMIIGVILALASIAMIAMPDSEPHWPQVNRLFEIGLSAAVMVAYVYLLPEAGFIISTAVISAFLSWRLGAQPLNAVIAGVLISLGIYVVFHLILGLSLAKGWFGF